MDRIELIPRFEQQGYGEEQVSARRAWIETKTSSELPLVGGGAVPTSTLRGNIENPIGTVQVPLGLAGPLALRGEHVEGTVYVPLATTEGALLRSYERGMVAITRSGGAVTRVLRDENRVAPVFVCRDGETAAALAGWLTASFAELQREAEATTRHGRLLRVEPLVNGRHVITQFVYSTGDAHGMNMIVRATDAACRWVQSSTPIERYLILTGACGEKRPAGGLFGGGKGKSVTASVTVPRRVLRAVMRVTARQMEELWRLTLLGQLHSGTLGYNGHAANGLTALFIACGQDVANVANSALAVTCFEEVGEGDLFASVQLPSLTVATVGGGTALGTARECLGLLGCVGSGTARRLAEIAAATVLAGELSMGAAIVSGEFVAAHETYGRNRPDAGAEPG